MRCTAAKLSNNLGEMGMILSDWAGNWFFQLERRDKTWQASSKVSISFVSSVRSVTIRNAGGQRCIRSKSHAFVFSVRVGLLRFTSHRMYLSVCHG